MWKLEKTHLEGLLALLHLLPQGGGLAEADEVKVQRVCQVALHLSGCHWTGMSSACACGKVALRTCRACAAGSWRADCNDIAELCGICSAR